MASNEEGSSNGKKSGGSRRHWSPKEEETLLTTMKELVAQGWKSDNGFRAGHLSKAQEIFRKHMPGTDVMGNPHILSKLASWKKNYNSISQILSKSGVGFNSDGTFKIEADGESWEGFIRVDSHATKIRGRSWPMYDAWKEIFGKDRAIGESAEDILQAVNELERDTTNTNGEDFLFEDYHVNLEDLFEADKGEDLVCQLQQPAENRRNKGKKRKTVDGIEQVCNIMQEINRSTNSNMEMLASRIGYDHDLGKARMEVFEKLGKIPHLTVDEKFNVCEILADKVQRLEIFLGLPEDARAMYVERLLQSND